jgi:hypothetical protein
MNNAPRASAARADELPEPSSERSNSPNPLDTAFGPHSKRAAQLRNEAHGGILEISDSALTHLPLSTVSKLGRIAEEHPTALRFFPEGSKLVVGADGESGDFESAGYLNVHCSLRYPSEKGGFKNSGKEVFHRVRDRISVESAFEKFLQRLEDKQLDAK